MEAIIQLSDAGRDISELRIALKRVLECAIEHRENMSPEAKAAVDNAQAVLDRTA